MKKVNIICKIIIALMLLFCLSYTILFLCAKYGSKIDIENSNSIYMYDKEEDTLQIYNDELNDVSDEKIEQYIGFVFLINKLNLSKLFNSFDKEDKHGEVVWKFTC